jgi:hypothetical protein
VSAPRVFSVSYQFLSCGSVFTDGLANAAAELGIEYQHALWDVPDLPHRIKAFAPDLLFVVHGRKFTQRWPKLIAQYPSAVWLLDEPYEVDDTSAWSSLYGTVCLNDPATFARHPRAVYVPVCYDHVVHTAGNGPRSSAVGFIGGGNATRERYLDALVKLGLLSYVVGGPWDSVDLQRPDPDRD